MEEKKSNLCVCLEVGGNNGGFLAGVSAILDSYEGALCSCL